SLVIQGLVLMEQRTVLFGMVWWPEHIQGPEAGTVAVWAGMSTSSRVSVKRRTLLSPFSL
ncbi:hypothetical protein GOODEAATRI_027547, partial [Goodea atripinnis]